MVPKGMDPEESLGRKLRRHRKAADKTIADMAQALGVNYNTLGGYERGETLPEIDFLAHFAQATGSSFLELLVARLQAMNSDAGRRALSELLSLEGAKASGLSEGWGATVDQALLENVLRETDSWQARRDTALPAEKKAKAVAIFYEMFSDSGRVDSAKVERVLELLA